VGSIIGKGGTKINEVRALSGATIKIMEAAPAAPGATEPERLVVITGAPPNIQMAVSMLYTVR
jgi:heterogeneous nuclear rnp K-like protein 2